MTDNAKPPCELAAAPGSELVLHEGQMAAICPNCRCAIWLSPLPSPDDMERIVRNDPPERVVIEEEIGLIQHDYRPNCPHCCIRLNVSIITDTPNVEVSDGER